jgi:ribose transport system permease protein
VSADRLRAYFPILTLVALVILVGTFDTSFLRIESLLQLASDVTALFVMALGITFVIYIGSIDLSAQSLASMTTVIVSSTIPVIGVGAVPLALLVGAGFGAVSGLIAVKAKIPTFIATLATAGIAYSIAQYVSGQKGLSIDVSLRESWLGWSFGNIGPVPKEIIVAGALLVVATIVERRTVAGRIFKAIGAGEAGAISSGIQVERFKIAAFAISGALAAMSGLMLAARLSGGSPTAADQFMLPAIVAVLVGGTPLTGGVGGVVNTMVGALIVAVTRASMVYLSIPAQGQQIFFGCVLIVAIALTIDRRKVRTVK